MRSSEERDQQTVAIMSALVVFAAAIALGGGVVYLVDRMTGLSETSLSWSVLVLVFAGSVLVALRLRRRG